MIDPAKGYDGNVSVGLLLDALGPTNANIEGLKEDGRVYLWRIRMTSGERLIEATSSESLGAALVQLLELLGNHFERGDA